MSSRISQLSSQLCGRLCRRITVQASQGKSARPYLNNHRTKKGACLASERPWVQTLVLLPPPKKKRKEKEYQIIMPESFSSVREL
jgi:hypothetical protein